MDPASNPLGAGHGIRYGDPSKVAAIASTGTLPTGSNKAGDSLGHS